jgi:hypothetical protein
MTICDFTLILRKPTELTNDLVDQFAKSSAPDLSRLLPGAWLAAHPDARRDWFR